MNSSKLLECILLVDDDPVFLLLAHSVLSDMLITNRVITITELQEAIDFLNNCTPDLILVDIVMPQMDGFEFIAKLCTSFKIDESRIVACSTYLRPTEIEKLNHLGIKYILKPISPEKILKILE